MGTERTGLLSLLPTSPSSSQNSSRVINFIFFGKGGGAPLKMHVLLLGKLGEAMVLSKSLLLLNCLQLKIILV